MVGDAHTPVGYIYLGRGQRPGDEISQPLEPVWQPQRQLPFAAFSFTTTRTTFFPFSQQAPHLASTARPALRSTSFIVPTLHSTVLPIRFSCLQYPAIHLHPSQNRQHECRRYVVLTMRPNLAVTSLQCDPLTLSSLAGVDFGTLNTVIAVARNRGVDVVCLPLHDASSTTSYPRPLPRLLAPHYSSRVCTNDTGYRSQTRFPTEPHRECLPPRNILSCLSHSSHR